MVVPRLEKFNLEGSKLMSGANAAPRKEPYAMQQVAPGQEEPDLRGSGPILGEETKTVHRGCLPPGKLLFLHNVSNLYEK
jgi:hypothetical protein